MHKTKMQVGQFPSVMFLSDKRLFVSLLSRKVFLLLFFFFSQLDPGFLTEPATGKSGDNVDGGTEWLVLTGEAFADDFEDGKKVVWPNGFVTGKKIDLPKDVHKVVIGGSEETEIDCVQPNGRVNLPLQFKSWSASSETCVMKWSEHHGWSLFPSTKEEMDRTVRIERENGSAVDLSKWKPGIRLHDGDRICLLKGGTPYWKGVQFRSTRVYEGNIRELMEESPNVDLFRKVVLLGVWLKPKNGVEVQKRRFSDLQCVLEKGKLSLPSSDDSNFLRHPYFFDKSKRKESYLSKFAFGHVFQLLRHYLGVGWGMDFEIYEQMCSEEATSSLRLHSCLWLVYLIFSVGFAYGVSNRNTMKSSLWLGLSWLVTDAIKFYQCETALDEIFSRVANEIDDELSFLFPADQVDVKKALAPTDTVPDRHSGTRFEQRGKIIPEHGMGEFVKLQVESKQQVWLLETLGPGLCLNGKPCLKDQKYVLWDGDVLSMNGVQVTFRHKGLWEWEHPFFWREELDESLRVFSVIIRLGGLFSKINKLFHYLELLNERGVLGKLKEDANIRNAVDLLFMVANIPGCEEFKTKLRARPKYALVVEVEDGTLLEEQAADRGVWLFPWKDSKRLGQEFGVVYGSASEWAEKMQQAEEDRKRKIIRDTWTSIEGGNSDGVEACQFLLFASLGQFLSISLDANQGAKNPWAFATFESENKELRKSMTKIISHSCSKINKPKDIDRWIEKLCKLFDSALSASKEKPELKTELENCKLIIEERGPLRDRMGSMKEKFEKLFPFDDLDVKYEARTWVESLCIFKDRKVKVVNVTQKECNEQMSTCFEEFECRAKGDSLWALERLLVGTRHVNTHYLERVSVLKRERKKNVEAYLSCMLRASNWMTFRFLLSIGFNDLADELISTIMK
jgi:hypothetical protein